MAYSCLHAVKFSPRPELELQPEYINLQNASAAGVLYRGLEPSFPAEDELTCSNIQLSRWLIATISAL